MSAKATPVEACNVQSKEQLLNSYSAQLTEHSLEALVLKSSSIGANAPRSMVRTVALISTLTAVTFAGSMNTGILTVSLPRMAIDLQLPRSLVLWPASVYSLACGCCLLLAGSIADIVGNRNINLLGTFVLGIFILAAGLARTGLQLILFRAFQGIGISMCFPTSTSILIASIPGGRARNVGFACLGLGIPFGFFVGLILGGVFESVLVGWRLGFCLCASFNIVLLIVNCFCLPKDYRTEEVTWARLAYEIDWIGILISSTSLGLLFYVFAMIAGSLSSMRDPTNTVLLSISVILLPLFVLWMHLQEKRGKPALIPNSLWKNTAFSAISIMVLFSWAVLQSMDWFFSLFFQQVQHLSALETSIRYLPNIMAGIVLNIVTGLLLHRIRVDYFVIITSASCTISPLLMAIINPTWSWWWCTFWAMLLIPVSVNVTFTIANLIITDAFPPHTQALAGAVFSTMVQIGTSVGIAVMAIISSSVTNQSSVTDKTSPEASLQGYRAVFWACFALMLLTTLVGMWGLRGVSKIGMKKE